MVQRHDIAHRADAHVTGPRGGPDYIEAGRRNPAFVGAKVMFDAESVVEPEFIADLKFAP